MTLFNHAVTWLRKNRVLLPGVSVLARQVSDARTAAERRLYDAVARELVVPEGRRVSELDGLRIPGAEPGGERRGETT